MPAGDGGFSSAQLHDIDSAIRAAETASRRELSVYVGHRPDVADPRDLAQRLHAALRHPRQSVLVFVDPVERRLEIVTGADSRVSDEAAGQVASAMKASFEQLDLVGGLKDGVARLGDAASR